MKIGKSLIFWLAAIVLLTAIANMTGQGTPARSAGGELPFSEFMNQAENNRIAEVTVSGPDVYGTYTDGGKFYTYTPYDPTMIETLRKTTWWSMPSRKTLPPTLSGESSFPGSR